MYVGGTQPHNLWFCDIILVLATLIVVDSLYLCTGQPLSDARVQAELAIFLIAGFETTGHTLAYALLELAANPRIQERVFQELVNAKLARAASQPASQPAESAGPGSEE